MPAHSASASWLARHVVASIGSFGLVGALSVVQSIVAWLIAPVIAEASPRQAAELSVGQSLVLWLTAPILAGAAFRGRRLGAYVGVAASAVAHRALMDSRAEPAPAEWSGLGVVFLNVILIVYLVIVALLVPLGSSIADRLVRRIGPRPGFGRLSRIAAAGGVVAMAVTFTLAVSIPDEDSFAMDVPTGWQIVDTPQRARWDPAYGNEFTAVLGIGGMPSTERPPETPVVGVSVAAGFSGRLDPGDCYRAFEGWTSISSLYRGDLVRSGDTTLPVGPAFELVRYAEGLTHHSYAVERERHVGYHARPLCYIVVVTVPDAWPMAEADVRAIAEGFSFR